MDRCPIRKIIHVDMDAFYASVEQRDNPELKGKPVAVGYPMKRGVVAAASYEARVYGVRSAMPSVTALRLCKELIFVPPRFDAYKAVSRQIREIFGEFTALIEPLSLDEAYLDVTTNLRGIATAAETAAMIRQRIFEETGLTASAGISYNKFLAKLASDMRKPNGQFVIPPERGAAFIEALEVKKFHGVGPVTAAKLNALGIVTGKDLREKPMMFLEQHFGKSGEWFYMIARGEDHRPVEPNRVRKSSGSETTFLTDLMDNDAIEAGVVNMADDVWTWCEKVNMYGYTVTVKVKFADFRIITRSHTVQHCVDSRDMLRDVAVGLVRSVLPVSVGVRLVGVTVSKFDDWMGAQLNLPLES
ncbi:MAG: DNA polymerase IV [Sphingobacteriales bacterium]|nr:MAG: DNA polymerase IV [Sphingobacteriales bacterium]